MKAHTASLINAITIIGIGLWSYFGSLTPSLTALIPVFAGILLLLTYRGLKNENKTIAHLASILTLLLFIAFFKPLMGAIDRNEGIGIFRIVIMMFTTLFALVIFVKSFIDSRKSR